MRGELFLPQKCAARNARIFEMSHQGPQNPPTYLEPCFSPCQLTKTSFVPITFPLTQILLYLGALSWYISALSWCQTPS